MGPAGSGGAEGAARPAGGCPPGVWSQGPRLSAAAKRGEPELCGECQEPGGLSHSPMRGEQIMYSRIRVRVPGPASGRAGGWVPSSPLRLPPAAPAPGSRRAHTRFLSISEHTPWPRGLRRRRSFCLPPAGLRGAGAWARSCLRDALLWNAGRRAAGRRRGAPRAGTGRARPRGAGGLPKRGEEKEKVRQRWAPLPLLQP